VLARLTKPPIPLDPAVVSRWRSPVRFGLSVLGVITLATIYSAGGPGYDFMAYWAVDPSSPYETTLGLGAFHYAPPFVFLAAPLSLLPFDMAYVVWTSVMAALLVWMTRSWALAWCAFPPVASELFHGNIHIAMAALIVVGIRYSPALGIVGLAKLTTSVAMLWPVFRRDWRGVIEAAAVVLAIVAASVLLQGTEIWGAWFAHLSARAETPHVGGALIDVPLALRLPAAAALLAWGAVSDRRWTLPVAVALSVPLLWAHSFAVLVAIPMVIRSRAEVGVMGRQRTPAEAPTTAPAGQPVP
jgi:Glycosyltransferase family 87